MGQSEPEKTVQAPRPTIGDERDGSKPAVAELEEYKKSQRKSALARLEDRAIDFLYSLIERPADNPRFWIVTAVGMLLVLAGPMIAISLFFLGRDYGFFG